MLHHLGTGRAHGYRRLEERRGDGGLGFSLDYSCLISIDTSLLTFIEKTETDLT